MRSIREEGVGGKGAPRGRLRLWRPHNEEVSLAGLETGGGLRTRGEGCGRLERGRVRREGAWEGRARVGEARQAQDAGAR